MTDKMWPEAKSEMLGETKVKIGLDRAKATDLIKEVSDVNRLVDRRFIE